MTRPNAANRTPDCRQWGCGAARGRVHQGASSIVLSDVRGVSARLISLSHKSHPPSLLCSMRSPSPSFWNARRQVRALDLLICFIYSRLHHEI